MADATPTAHGNATHTPVIADGQEQPEPTIPGTVHLVDLEGSMRGKHAADIVLIPAPSDE